MNKEFQILKGQYSSLSTKREIIIEKMRQNLLQRNSNNNLYILEYTQKGPTFDIASCSVEELFKIDGDMSPLGL